ncbi:helix-turn-helix domain-containing protein [Pseudomonas knackmussii]|uniref:helix-turn-helix domain-containing protein n=1 Tax=Pseudomonas knackmussii TaxID=65741 RepID=UPI001363DD3B|nr:helix-turn-helix transcriptional regulator [Pseudomonas knackmussii]
MGRERPNLYPALERLLLGFGERIRLARLRRDLSMVTVAEEAGLSRETLNKVERGDPGVALGSYARVLEVLGLAGDIDLWAQNDDHGRQLQDDRLPKRASRRKAIDDGGND